MTPLDRVTPLDVDRRLCERSFAKFLAHVRIQEPPDPRFPGSGGVVPFQQWPHLLAMADLLTSSRLAVVLKARQVGATWLIATYLAWLGIYRPGTDGLLLSKSEDDAADFLARARTALLLLPPHLSAPFSKPPTALSFSLANGSRLTAMAATEDAGRGHVYSLIVQDEADYHPYLEANYLAVKPTIDAGGQLIMLSTVNKRRMLSLFKGLYRGAPENGWRRLFIPYDARPGRDAEWRERMRLEAPTATGLTPDLYIEQEYPASSEEALAPSRALAWFDQDVLAWMLEHQAMPVGKQEGMVSLWKPPAVGGHYVIGADTAWGKKGSYTAATVMVWETAEQVAELHGRLPPNDAAYELTQLHKRYNHAYMGLERAGEGQERDGDAVVVVDKVVELLRDCGCYRRLFYADHAAAVPRKPGWQTDGRSRPVMLGELREAVRERQVIIRSREGIGEMMTFIQSEKGRPEAALGTYDDRVMAHAVAWQMRGYARFRDVVPAGRSRLVAVPLV